MRMMKKEKMKRMDNINYIFNTTVDGKPAVTLRCEGCEEDEHNLLVKCEECGYYLCGSCYDIVNDKCDACLELEDEDDEEENEEEGEDNEEDS